MAIFDVAVNAVNKQLLGDIEEIAKRSLAAGVDKWLMVAGNIEEARQSLDLAATLTGNGLEVWCTAGVHPHDAKGVTEDFIHQLREIQQQAKVVAIGECGLDFNRDFSPRPQQIRVFEQQLELAVELQKPLYLHERDAATTFLSIIDQYIDRLPRILVHCFTGELDTLRQYLEREIYIGVTGWICDERRGGVLRDLIHYIPADRLMIETDAPFLMPRNLTPKPQSRRNEPCYLPHIAKTIADLLNQDVATVLAHCYRTSCRFFSVD